MSYETQRLNALRAYRILETDSHPSFDCVTRAAAGALRVPIALISLVDGERQWFKSFVGLTVRETPRCISFCSHAIERPGVFEVEDARCDPRFVDNPLVTGAPYIRFYAGVPLIDHEGFALGTLCVISPQVRTLEPVEVSVLEALGECAMNAISLHYQGLLLRRAEKLMAARATPQAKSAA